MTSTRNTTGIPFLVGLSRLGSGTNTSYPEQEFHLRGDIRRLLQVEDRLFSIKGNIVFANFYAARKLAQRLNDHPELLHTPDQSARASHLNAMGIMDEILHYVVQLYLERVNPEVFKKAWQVLEKELGKEVLHQALIEFIRLFPPTPVFHGALSPEQYLKGKTQGIPNRELVLEELIMTWLDNENPAYQPYRALFDDSALRNRTPYLKIIRSLDAFFRKEPPFGPDNQPLLEMLQTPARLAPQSLKDQLEFMRQRWGLLLADFLFRLMGSTDFLKEEEKIRFPAGPGPAEVPVYSGEEPERYSPDRDWMPRLVLIAKSTLVWLDQLSKKYQQPIQRLDQIPDAELDKLARWGFSGLWLIGIWRRSKASKKIKQLCGNPDAEASAYALYDYEVAPELGGEEALKNLQHRCWQRGIRLASDMVPNHTGIDARWVMEHPDWFIQIDHPPFPNYTFNGPNLSDDPNIGIYIEDHYYDRSDAAVVFKRVDFRTGETRYIYHGNDGTSIPWNDTAQLNYLLPEVREVVIQKILEVARRFPIIRFDAAMTLTKKHFQRLWFPEPGSGGDIPSRAEFAMTREEFDRHMPNEFWREVVDRVAQEAPDTLLLAEAFWLMESYFVRTLGMHRVYNSAFMNMLKNEENAKYRELLKNTLAYDPQILKRYVNFMNNPDEETAVAQFGKGDKYFGVCTLLVTLPGLPMFGHGQVEGFTEKYGMEYRRAYLDEPEDEALIARHEQEIFPLMKQRALFAEVEHFQLYDVVDDQGVVQENLFAFSNGNGNARTLVLYNNSLQPAAGWIRFAAPKAIKLEDGSTQLRSIPLAEALGLRNQENVFTIFYDHVGRQFFIRNNRELFEKGLFVSLQGYQYHVFLDFQQVEDNRWGHFAELHRHLAGRGVEDIHKAVQEILYGALHQDVKQLIRDIIRNPVFPWKKTPAEAPDRWVETLCTDVQALTKELRTLGQTQLNEAQITARCREQLQRWSQLESLRTVLKPTRIRKAISALKFLEEWAREQSDGVYVSTLLWLALQPVLVQVQVEEEDALAFLRESLGLPDNLSQVLTEAGWPPSDVEEAVAAFRVWPHLPPIQPEQPPLSHNNTLLLNALENPVVREYLKVNEYQGNVWFNKERYETFLWLTLLNALVPRPADNPTQLAEDLKCLYRTIEYWLKGEQASGYLLVKLIQFIRKRKG